jgi:hypothetical protein
MRAYLQYANRSVLLLMAFATLALCWSLIDVGRALMWEAHDATVVDTERGQSRSGLQVIPENTVIVSYSDVEDGAGTVRQTAEISVLFLLGLRDDDEVKIRVNPDNPEEAMLGLPRALAFTGFCIALIVAAYFIARPPSHMDPEQWRNFDA